MTAYDVADLRLRPACWLVRLLLAGGLLAGWVLDLSQLEGKGWGARTVFYGMVMVVLPLTWRMSGRQFCYSYLADTLLVLPFTFDTCGNLAGLFDSLDSFDDILHFLNWFALVGAFVITLLRTSTLSRVNIAALGTGFGATAIVLWEAMEYVVMKLGTERLALTYTDTIGDLVLSTAGGFAASVTLVVSLPPARRHGRATN